MLAFLPSVILIPISFSLYFLISLLLASVVFIEFLLWLITPFPKLRKKIQLAMFHHPSIWTKCIRVIMKLTTKTQITIHGLEGLNKDNSYLLIANHQSYLDILTMQLVFDPYVPQLRYFMKQALIWIPLVGQACYLLGYPFMKRYSAKTLTKKPYLKNKDVATTQKACERFASMPITLINYVEGTRYNEKKRLTRKSPYQFLLRPKAGGIAFILSAMKQQIKTILNVTIIYSTPNQSTLNFLAGKLKKIDIYIEQLPVTDELRGDYQNNSEFRQSFQTWLNNIWQEKDQLIAKHNKIT